MTDVFTVKVIPEKLSFRVYVCVLIHISMCACKVGGCPNTEERDTAQTVVNLRNSFDYCMLDVDGLG